MVYDLKGTDTHENYFVQKCVDLTQSPEVDDGNEDYDPESVSFEKMDKSKKKRKRSRFHDEPQFSDEDDEGKF